MPKSQADHDPGYFTWSRDPAVGIFVVLPLWMGYELLRLGVMPGEINGAEWVMAEALYRLPTPALDVLRVLTGLVVLVAAWSIHYRDIPWMRVGLVTMLEGVVYGLMLGPLAGLLTAYSVLDMQASTVGSEGAGSQVLAKIVAALGAGLFEELVFRLFLLSLLAWLLARTAQSFGMPKGLGIGLALLLSALLFSLFHHLGDPGGAVDYKVFVFRTMAGLILGLLFACRGIGVCVYTHAMYDVHFYLNQP